MTRLLSIVAVGFLCVSASTACGSSGDDGAGGGAGAGGAVLPGGDPAGEPAIEDETPDGVEPAIPDPPEPPEGAPSATPNAAAATLRPGCTAKGTMAGHPAWFFFTRPDKPCTGAAGSGLDSHILDELTRLIDAVPTGGRIDGHIFSITVDSVARALLKAQTRGVDVWISTDGEVAKSTDPAKTEYLDKLTHKVYCAAAGRSSCVSSGDKAISHTKLFVFSATTTPDGAPAKDVVWLGSANQTYASGMRLYNNTVTVFGDGGLFTKLRGYLDDLYERRSRADYYDPASGRGHLLAESADVYVSPEQQTDLVVNRLDDINPDGSCEIRVIQASIRDSRLDVVSRLATLKQGGCKIQVVAQTVEPRALAALSRANIPVRTKPIHDKSFIVHAKYGGVTERRVYTGSHNLSGGAAHKYDEIFVKLAAERQATHPVYDAYLTHFQDAYGDAKPLN
jgi:hypothetical protein